MTLFNTWQALATAADEALQGHIAYLFGQLQQTACDVLTEDAARFSRLGSSDERAFAQFIRLMGAYREAVWLIEASAETHVPAVKELLGGICDILTSRARQFEDMAVGQDTPNPVSDEKRGIVERAHLYTTRQIENLIATFPGKIAPASWAALRGAFLMEETENWQESLGKYVRELGIPEVYTHYQDGLRFCLIGLDDLHARKSARLYTELIEREWEVLEALIRVQAKALEDITTSPSPSSEVTARVLDLLREAYQQTGPLVENLQRLPKNTRVGQTSPCRTYDEFENALGPLPQIGQATPIDPTPFYEALTEETANVFGQQRIAFLKAAYRLQRMVGVEILLAEEAAALFSTTCAALKAQEIEADEGERQILTGILETLEIKIESLRESIKDFNGEGASLLQKFAKEKTDVTDEIKEAAYAHIRVMWLAAPPTEAELPCFFARCQEGESFAPYRADYEKHVAHYTDKMGKAALRFKKDVLLYEVGTYEEILTHSVSRLGESANEAVLAAAARLHDTYAALEILLRKNNIIPIRPAPHDVFNGKEHEVLVAEKHEGFAKGEIIKLMGSGYRHEDRVLMRANVIAAR
ncbi:MAG: nucleotide exchange factor GrpE [Defluviitaleaceae bacterium]|nr:nucleotide exchange factor GrpE [Defluviitaleaceae bacterium]MCL2239984.1 nucleotide exchange factor GrpE [Defluviitaleaceae bacterium]